MNAHDPRLEATADGPKPPAANDAPVLDETHTYATPQASTDANEDTLAKADVDDDATYIDQACLRFEEAWRG